MAVLYVEPTLEFWKFRSVLYFLVSTLFLYSIATAIEKFFISHYYINAPAVGRPRGIFGRFKQPYVWMHNALTSINEGMQLHGQFGKPFKIQAPYRWNLFLTSAEHIAELKTLPKSVMFFRAAADEQLRTEYNFYPGIMAEAHHVPLMQKNMTENGIRLLPQLVEEIAMAVGNTTSIGLTWTPVDIAAANIKIISQATNRVFVGTPLNRLPDFQEAILDYATAVVGCSTLLDKTPRILQPLVAAFVLRRDKTMPRILSFLGPIFEDRRQKLRLLGKADWPDKPHDAIQWIVEASDPRVSIRDMTLRLMFFELASIHTTSNAATHLVYDLAANPQFQEPLREEARRVLAEHGGWNAKALAQVKLLDSCLKESGRLNGSDVMTMRRRAMQPYTFKDGTHVPKGTWVAVPACALHRMSSLYDKPNEFDGFRFARMREEPGKETSFQFTSTSPEYMTFGHGVSSCPGR